MKIKLNLELIRFDKEKYKLYFDDWLFQTLSVMAAAYLEATVINVITGRAGEYRVWRGASAATFLPLAEAIQFRIPIQRGTPSGISEGLTHGVGGLDIKKGKGSFFYGTDLVHLIWNEYHDANVASERGAPLKLTNPGPYGFQEQGVEAVKHALASNKVGLPNPWLAITKTKVKVS